MIVDGYIKEGRHSGTGRIGLFVEKGTFIIEHGASRAEVKVEDVRKVLNETERKGTDK